MDTPPNPQLPLDAVPRSSQFILTAAAILSLLLMTYRGYGNLLGLRPTQHEPGAIRHRVDLNAADRAEMLQVPGIGPRLTDAILTHRVDYGPFTAVDELERVRGVGGKTLDKLRPWLKVEPTEVANPTVERLVRMPMDTSSPVRPVTKIQPGDQSIDVNIADEATLSRLPGIGPTLAKRIIDTREVERFKTPEDLRRVKGIGPKTMESIRPYIVCR